jgi:arylsulfatase A-like enzyme
VSLLRAQYAHNHNITFVSAPWGGWDVFNQQGYVGQTLPDFLQQAGYNTYYTGKFMNDHTEKNCESLPVSGYVGGPRTETYVLTRRTRPTSSSTRTRTTIGT